MSITNCDEFYLEKYNGFIKRVVNNFIRAGNNSCADIKDDLFQEACIQLLKWIQKREKEEFNIARSALDIKNALYEYVTKNTGVHMRHHNLKKYYQKYTMCSDELLSETHSHIQDVDYIIDFNKWRKTLPIQQRRIVDLKMRGMNDKEIGLILDIPQRTVNRRLNEHIKQKYNLFFNDTHVKKLSSEHNHAA